MWLLSGLRQSDIMDCVAWMRPLAHVLDQQQRVELKKFPQVAVDNSHNIQTHVVSLELLVCCCQNIYIIDRFYQFVNVDIYRLEERIMEMLYGTKNGVDAFGCNSAESESIWMKKVYLRAVF